MATVTQEPPVPSTAQPLVSQPSVPVVEVEEGEVQRHDRFLVRLWLVCVALMLIAGLLDLIVRLASK